MGHRTLNRVILKHRVPWKTDVYIDLENLILYKLSHRRGRYGRYKPQHGVLLINGQREPEKCLLNWLYQKDRACNLWLRMTLKQ